MLLLPIRLLLLAEPDWSTLRFLPRLIPGRGKTFDRAELIFQHQPHSPVYEVYICSPTVSAVQFRVTLVSQFCAVLVG